MDYYRTIIIKKRKKLRRSLDKILLCLRVCLRFTATQLPFVSIFRLFVDPVPQLCKVYDGTDLRSKNSERFSHPPTVSTLMGISKCAFFPLTPQMEIRQPNLLRLLTVFFRSLKLLFIVLV